MELIIIITIISVVVLLGVFSIIYLYFKKKNKKEVYTSPYIEGLVNALGSINNIISTSVEQRRIKFSLNDLSLIDEEALKTFSQSITISGNNIKILLPDDPTVILKAIENMR